MVLMPSNKLLMISSNFLPKSELDCLCSPSLKSHIYYLSPHHFRAVLQSYPRGWFLDCSPHFAPPKCNWQLKLHIFFSAMQEQSRSDVWFVFSFPLVLCVTQLGLEKPETQKCQRVQTKHSPPKNPVSFTQRTEKRAIQQNRNFWLYLPVLHIR